MHKASDILQGSALAAQLIDFVHIERELYCRIAQGPEDEYPVRVANRQLPQHHGVEDREHRGRHPDPDPED